MSETETKRGRRTGGRERRDPNARATGPAYIKRVIPTYDIMGEESLLKIEATADRILAEVGLDIRDDDEAGAIVETSLDAYVGEQVRDLGHHVVAAEEVTCALAHGRQVDSVACHFADRVSDVRRSLRHVEAQAARAPSARQLSLEEEEQAVGLARSECHVRCRRCACRDATCHARQWLRSPWDRPHAGRSRGARHRPPRRV